MREAFGILLYVFLSATALDNLQRNKYCTNPYGVNGTCVPLDECQEIYDVSTSKNGIDFLFATKSYCGSDEEVLVCCQYPGPIESTNLNINSLLGIKECGLVKEQPKYYGGVQAEIGEFPWLVAIIYELKRDNSDAGIRCGGSLINDEYVLTAAHCLLNDELETTFVRLGDWDVATDPDCVELVANTFCADPIKSIAIKETIPHPFYSKHTLYNDIGLIRLEEKVPFTDFIAPICLPHRNIPPPKASERLTVAGWGVTESGTIPTTTLKLTIPVLSENECRMHQWKGIHRHVFCAGGEPAMGECADDIGGLLTKSYNGESNGVVWYLHGIPSYGNGCRKRGSPRIYVNVSYYIGWILKTIREYSKTGL